MAGRPRDARRESTYTKVSMSFTAAIRATSVHVLERVSWREGEMVRPRLQISGRQGRRSSLAAEMSGRRDRTYTFQEENLAAPTSFAPGNSPFTRSRSCSTMCTGMSNNRHVFPYERLSRRLSALLCCVECEAFAKETGVVRCWWEDWARLGKTVLAKAWF